VTTGQTIGPLVKRIRLVGDETSEGVTGGAMVCHPNVVESNSLTHRHQENSIPVSRPALHPEMPMGDHCNDTSECTLSGIQDNSIGDTIPSDHILDSTQDLDVNLGASMGPLDRPTDAHTLEIPRPGDVPFGDLEDLWDQDCIQLDDLKLSVEFIKGLRESDLSNPTLGLPVEAVDCLHSPSCAPPGLGINEDTRLAICLYLESPSDALYETTRAAMM